MAHAGVLFLDELGEFPVAVLEALRQPLEDGVVRISRSAASATMPARFQLVAAMNPCPCGEGTTVGSCRCSEAARSRYARRLSAPLLDRFDLRIDVLAPDALLLLTEGKEEPSVEVARRVTEARAVSADRGVRCNAALSSSQIDQFASLDSSARALAERALRAGELSGRGLRRVRAVARTIADLQDARPQIDAQALSLALSLRSKPLLGGIS
jgi:magnesium chelatase family protein